MEYGGPEASTYVDMLSLIPSITIIIESDSPFTSLVGSRYNPLLNILTNLKTYKADSKLSILTYCA